MEKTQQIDTVQNNKDRQRTYRENIKRYNMAMKNEFFFEAILIDYAMLEGRLSSLLYHMGVIADRENRKICKKTKKQLQMLNDRFQGREDAPMSIATITGKMNLIKAILDWAENSEGTEDDRYLISLKSGCIGAVDISYLLKVLNDIEQWKDYRNEIIHGLMNKNMDSLYSEVGGRAEEGMLLARGIDNEIKKLKKEHIRKKVGLAEK